MASRHIHMPVCCVHSLFCRFASPYARAVQLRSTRVQCATQGHVQGEFERGRACSGAVVPFVQGARAALGCAESGALPF
jgi:hypothetical protein